MPWRRGWQGLNSDGRTFRQSEVGASQEKRAKAELYSGFLMHMKIAIVGLGYVGLPLSLQFAQSGVSVLGLDIDPMKVKKLNAGQTYIKHVLSEAIRAELDGGRFSASGNFGLIREVEAVIICVPTPLNKNREPDISYVLETGRAIAPHLQRGTVVILESTSYPGTTDEDLKKVLEENSGLKAGVDFHLAFSPEREDPGNPDSKVGVIPKIVGGLTPACCDKAVAVYSRAIKKIVPVSCCRTAEAAKLLENIFRSVNIALVNELKMVYDAMGINIWEVIAAAKTKPFGFMAFYPGPGLGGHCIPIDPFYLTWKAREYGQSTRFIELAGEVNTSVPLYVVHKTLEALNHHRKPLRGSRVLVLGLAYKANVDDMRESPAFHLMDRFQAGGAEVAYYDPFIPVIGPTREHGSWEGRESVAWNQATVGSFDVVVICTAHATINFQELVTWAPCIVDTRNAVSGIKTKANQVWKA